MFLNEDVFVPPVRGNEHEKLPLDTLRIRSSRQEDFL